MNCPKCKSKTAVVDCRPLTDGIVFRRRHECLSCHHRFTTAESIVPDSRQGKRIIARHTQNDDLIPFSIYSAIIDALDHARTKHPHFADSDAEAGNIILEELLEVNDAALRVVRNINDQASRDNLLTELAQLNATTIRMMEMMLK